MKALLTLELVMQSSAVLAQPPMAAPSLERLGAFWEDVVQRKPGTLLRRLCGGTWAQPKGVGQEAWHAFLADCIMPPVRGLLYAAGQARAAEASRIRPDKGFHAMDQDTRRKAKEAFKHLHASSCSPLAAKAVSRGFRQMRVRVGGS